MMLTSRVGLLLLVIAVGVTSWIAGCSKPEQDDVYLKGTAPETVGEQSKARAADGPRQEQHQASSRPKREPIENSQQPGYRKLIRSASLHVEVSSYEAARRAVDKKLAKVKGYVELAQVDHSEGTATNVELTLRVPASELEAFVAKCSSLGTVIRERVATSDITEEYQDADARLRNARNLEERLLELLETETNGVKDLLEVERELARVREKIETIEGKLRLYEDRVAMSKLELRLTTRDVYVAGESETLGEETSRALSTSASALVAFGRRLLVVGVAFLPWLPILLLIGYGGYRLVRWLSMVGVARMGPPPNR